MILDPVYRHIGSVIQSRRKALRMTQEVLSSKLGISRGSLANIETGRQNMLVHHLYRFAAALDLGPTDFLPAAKDVSGRLEFSSLPLPRDLNKSQKEQIVRLYEGVNPDNSQFGEDSRAISKKR